MALSAVHARHLGRNIIVRSNRVVAVAAGSLGNDRRCGQVENSR
jgi:hypothetical protein